MFSTGLIYVIYLGKRVAEDVDPYNFWVVRYLYNYEIIAYKKHPIGCFCF